jgi:hypothetical protein
MNRQLPSADLAYPIEPQEWHFRQSVDYSISLNRAVLDYAARMRENLLYGVYQMGTQSIARGNTDTWTPNPKRYADAAAKFPASEGGRGGGGGENNAQREAQLWTELRKPELRDPRGYIIPSDQTDFATATKFINALRETGITVQRATREFEVKGKKYPVGSFVVLTAQAFRPHVIDMFEPQVHPDVFPIPGGAPTPPYDNAGWTLAFQMGVQFDRILEGFTGPFEPVNDWNVALTPGRVVTPERAVGFLSSRQGNNAFVAMNRLLKAGEEVQVLTQPLVVGGRTYPAGTWYVRAKGTTRTTLDALATQLGVSFDGARAAPAASATRTARIGLWDQYGGSMTSGWTRWILEQFEFPFARVFAPELDAGNLNAKYDVLILPNGAINAAGGRGAGAPVEDLPAEYRNQVGRVSPENTIPRLREFVERGGTVIAIGESAANLAAQLKLPIEDHLVENGRPLPRTKFYSPGSLLTARFDPAQPLAYGMNERTDVFFDDSPVFKLAAGAEAAGVKRIGWFDSAAPLHSGWAWGQSVLENGVVAAEVPLGQGKVVLFGPEILQRAQPHATFKLLFNALYLARGRGTTSDQHGGTEKHDGTETSIKNVGDPETAGK